MSAGRFDIGSLDTYYEAVENMERIDLNGKRILVTGSAGFIGSNLVLRLFKDLKEGTIVGLDNLNNYYDPTLKEYRLRTIEAGIPVGIKYAFFRGDLADKAFIVQLFAQYHFDVVVNLAAQAGVRYSIENPDAYIQSNMIGFYNILEACRHSKDVIPGSTGNPYEGVQHLVYASSSSVYGGNKKVPFSVEDRVDNPVCRHKEEQRTLRALLQQTVRHSYHRAALLHSLWTGRSPRYGVLWIYQ